MLIDSHAHLDSHDFDRDRADVISRSNTGYILTVATDIETLVLSEKIADQNDRVYVGAGIHPHSSDKIDLDEFSGKLSHKKLRAIGEIGLDYYREYSPKDKQKYVFNELLKLAQDRELPVIVHQRNARNDVLDILKNVSVKGVMHCFSGDVNYAKECLELGFYISFAGNITYPKANMLREAVKSVPLERLLIETDCPWLAPQQVRGKRNEPLYVKYVAEEIAKIKEVSIEEIESVTLKNFRDLFAI